MPGQHQQQRPFFLSHFFSSFRPQPASLRAQSRSASAPTTTAPTSATTSSSANASGYHSYTSARFSAVAAAAAAQQAARAAAAAGSSNSAGATSPQQQQQQQQQSQQSRSIPINIPTSRRRGSNSSSEGFRETMGAERYYIGGRTAAGEEKYFKLGVVRRVKSNDGLSLDRLSL